MVKCAKVDASIVGLIMCDDVGGFTRGTVITVDMLAVLRSLVRVFVFVD